jgi:hypothetical protein
MTFWNNCNFFSIRPFWVVVLVGETVEEATVDFDVVGNRDVVEDRREIKMNVLFPLSNVNSSSGGARGIILVNFWIPFC